MNKYMRTSLVTKGIITAAITAVSLVSLSVNADMGVGAGNGGDRVVPFKGFTSNHELPHKELAHPQLERHYNMYSVSAKLVSDINVQNMAKKTIEPSDIFKFYKDLPEDKSDLKDLYDAAVSRRGDYSNLTNPQNPFAKYLDADTFSKNRIANLIANSIEVYPIESINKVVTGQSIEINLKINEHLQDQTCSHRCKEDDYKPIDASGIALRVKCTPNRYDKGSYFELGDEIIIRSQQDNIYAKIPFTNEFAEYLRLQSCDTPYSSVYKAKITCKLVPSTKGDEEKFNQAFDTKYLELKNTNNKYYFDTDQFIIEFVDYKLDKDGKDIDSVTVHSSGLIEHTRGNNDFRLPVVGYVDIPFTGGLVGYKFNPGFEVSTLYYKTEADLADFVRRNFIEAFEHTKF